MAERQIKIPGPDHPIEIEANPSRVVVTVGGQVIADTRDALKFNTPPERRATTPKPCSPSYFRDYLSRRWAEGCIRGRELLHEIKLRGYTGSFSHLERLLAKWRSAGGSKVATLPAAPTLLTAPPVATAPRAVDPATGWLISPIVA